MSARAHLESLLRARKLDVTLTTAGAGALPRLAEDRASTGLASLDAQLDGGLRRGHLSEIVGPRSTGRGALLCALLAVAAARGEAVALVDASDRFDPASAASSGVELSQLLWVREHGDAARALKAMSLVLQAGHFGLVVLDLSDVPASAVRAFPFTTWLRVARTIEGSQTVALLVGTDRIARSPGGVTIALERPGRHAAVTWEGKSSRARLLGPLTLRPRVVTARVEPPVRPAPMPSRPSAGLRPPPSSADRRPTIERRPGTESRTRSPESRAPNPESRIPSPESRIPNPESLIPDPHL
jgi:hypothetical protein